MGIQYAAFAAGDVYIDFPYQEVFFRFEKATGRVLRKFYGEAAETEIPRDNRLYSEGVIAGSEVTADLYSKGRPRRVYELSRQ